MLQILKQYQWSAHEGDGCWGRGRGGRQRDSSMYTPLHVQLHDGGAGVGGARQGQGQGLDGRDERDGDGEMTWRLQALRLQTAAAASSSSSSSSLSQPPTPYELLFSSLYRLCGYTLDLPELFSSASTASPSLSPCLSPSSPVLFTKKAFEEDLTPRLSSSAAFSSSCSSSSSAMPEPRSVLVLFPDSVTVCSQNQNQPHHIQQYSAVAGQEPEVECIFPSSSSSRPLSPLLSRTSSPPSSLYSSLPPSRPSTRSTLDPAFTHVHIRDHDRGSERNEEQERERQREGAREREREKERVHLKRSIKLSPLAERLLSAPYSQPVDTSLVAALTRAGRPVPHFVPKALGGEGVVTKFKSVPKTSRVGSSQRSAKGEEDRRSGSGNGSVAGGGGGSVFSGSNTGNTSNSNLVASELSFVSASSSSPSALMLPWRHQVKFASQASPTSTTRMTVPPCLLPPPQHSHPVKGGGGRGAPKSTKHVLLRSNLPTPSSVSSFSVVDTANKYLLFSPKFVAQRILGDNSDMVLSDNTVVLQDQDSHTAESYSSLLNQMIEHVRDLDSGLSI